MRNGIAPYVPVPSGRPEARPGAVRRLGAARCASALAAALAISLSTLAAPMAAPSPAREACTRFGQARLAVLNTRLEAVEILRKLESVLGREESGERMGYGRQLSPAVLRALVRHKVAASRERCEAAVLQRHEMAQMVLSFFEHGLLDGGHPAAGELRRLAAHLAEGEHPCDSGELDSPTSAAIQDLIKTVVDWSSQSNREEDAVALACGKVAARPR